MMGILKKIIVMGTGSLLKKMGMFMKEIGRMENSMVLVFKNMERKDLKVLDMREISIKVKKKEREYFAGVMEINMMAIGKRIKLKVLEDLYGMM